MRDPQGVARSCNPRPGHNPGVLKADSTTSILQSYMPRDVLVDFAKWSRTMKTLAVDEETHFRFRTFLLERRVKNSSVGLQLVLDLAEKASG